MKFRPVILFPVAAMVLFGACERRSAAVILPEYVAKKEAEAATKLQQEEQQNVDATAPSPQFFRESDSR